MSKLSTILLVIILAGGLLAPTTVASSSSLTDAVNVDTLVCGNLTTVRLLTDQRMEAGTVTVVNDQTNIFVTYRTGPSYRLSATHLAMSNSLTDIPKTSKGKPIPEQFPFQTNHDNAATFSYTIPLTGLNSTVYIAAQADVTKSRNAQSAWGEGTLFNVKQRSWGMYFTYSIQPCNQPPVAVDDTASVTEDASATSISVLANDLNPSGTPFTIASANDPVDGTVIVAGDGLSLSYQPDANYCTDSTSIDNFIYTITPGGSVGNVSVTVTCVNDAPSFNLPASPNQNVGQGAGAQIVSGFATNISAGPANESGQMLTFNISNNNNALFSSQPDIDEITGDLTYESANGATGSAIVSVSLMDNGGTANGGVDMSTTQTFNITVTTVNMAPVAAEQNASTDEDTLKTITLLATDAEGNSLTFSIVNGPSNGSLGSLGIVSCGTGACTVNVDYMPAANFNGTDSFTFKANDGQTDSNTVTMDIIVNAVNDAPSFTTGADQTVLEDAGPQTVNGWATTISVGPSDEGSQTVTFNITGNTNPGLFSAGPAVASNGDLTYSPAPNAFGSATITLNLQDNGGTDNGGTDTSAPQSFVINVTPVNDAPSFTKSTDQTVDEDSSAQSVPDWATAISAGPNESGQTVSFLVSNNNNALFSAQPAISAAGVLTYTPAANQNGSATVIVQLQDNGGTANGGVDTSAAQTFTITINAVNDAPVAQTKTASAQTNMKIVGVNAGLLTGVTDADSGINGCTPTFTVASITAGSGGTVSNVNLGAGTFDFDPTAGFTGMAVVNYTVQDNGCLGTATSAPAAINITVSGPVIWFVNNAVMGPGAGTLADPFKTLASADAVDAANHRIFLYAATYSAGITLNSGEWLVGQGVTGFVSFDALMSITPPAGTIARPTLGGGGATVQNTVTLATNAIVKAITISASGTNQGLVGSGGITGVDVSQTSISIAGATALSLNNVAGTVTLNAVSVNGGAIGIDLTNVSAAVSISSGTIQNTTTAGVSINGGAGNFSEMFSTLSNSTGRTILVQNRTGGTVTFTGAINGGGTGILLNNNTSSTINFPAGTTMNLSTGANAAFTATGGGTVSVSGSSKTIMTTTGTALTIQNTTIGATGVTFTSISTNGAANGIVLSNTGSIGGLTVTGNGGTCTLTTPTCTGGSIQASTDVGVSLTSTRNVSLRFMKIQNSGTDGINANTVNGFSLIDSIVTDTTGGVVDEGIEFDNITGTITLTRIGISGAPHNGVYFDNFNTNLTAFNITGSTIQNTNAPGTSANGFLFTARGTSVVTAATITGSTITNSLSTGIQVQTNDTANIQNFTIGQTGAGNGNTILNNDAGVDMNLSEASSITFNIVNNTLNGHHSQAISASVATGSTGGTMTGKIQSNLVGTQGVLDSGSAIGSGIQVIVKGGAAGVFTIDNNTIREVPNARGIDLEGFRTASGNGGARFKVTNNMVVQPSGTNQSICGPANTPCPLASLWISADNETTSGNYNVCSVVTSNTMYDPTSYALGGEAAYYLQENTFTGPSTHNLEGTNVDPATQITNTNTVTNQSWAPVIIDGGVVVVAPGTCGSFPP